MNPSGQPASNSILSKPMFSSGVKPNIPANIIKPGKIIFKEKFKMDKPDETQSGLKFLKREEEEVDSIIDNEILQNRGDNKL